MKSPIALFLAWRERRRADRAIVIAERRRLAIATQIADRRAHKREWRYLAGDLRRATEQSLAASCGRMVR
ncbi:MAG: hypothetical protein H0W39_00905 [Sphingomonas sp.]|nr:hypothetical protein [Sphingomonas sp.]